MMDAAVLDPCRHGWAAMTRRSLLKRSLLSSSASIISPNCRRIRQSRHFHHRATSLWRPTTTTTTEPHAFQRRTVKTLSSIKPRIEIDDGTLVPSPVMMTAEEATSTSSSPNALALAAKEGEDQSVRTRGRITWTRLLIYKHLAKRAALRTPLPPRETMPIYLRHFLDLQPIGFVHVDKSIFHEAIRPDLMHRAVMYIMNLRRQGTHSTKSRGQVRGSNRKLRPQKGTGRSRMSTRKTPLHRGGGRAHGPKTRDYRTKLQRKVRLFALRSALATKFAQNELQIVDSVRLPTHKTKDLFELRENTWQLKQSILIVGDESELTNLSRAANMINKDNNRDKVTVMMSRKINVYDILRHKHLILSVEALRYLHAFISKTAL